MRQVICNKCESFIGTEETMNLKLNSVRFTADAPVEISENHYNSDFDLCLTCLLAFTNWLKEKPTGK